MKAKLTALVLLLSLISCDTGYQKENGRWVWISYDTGAGKRVRPVAEHDFKSFELLNEKYAKDKNSVFHFTNKIKNADPNSFTLIGNDYSKDENHVFLEDEMVVFANPSNFRLLEFPYSKDDTHVFCGTLPLQLTKEEVQEFRISSEDGLRSSAKSTILLPYFIKNNPEFKWLDTLAVEKVIIGETATGETNNKKFRGLKEVK